MENAQALIYLVNQLFSMSNDQHLVGSMRLPAPYVDVMNNAREQICLASSRRHLQHNVMHLIPSLEDVALRFLLVGMQRGYFAIL